MDTIEKLKKLEKMKKGTQKKPRAICAGRPSNGKRGWSWDGATCGELYSWCDRYSY